MHEKLRIYSPETIKRRRREHRRAKRRKQLLFALALFVVCVALIVVLALMLAGLVLLLHLPWPLGLVSVLAFGAAVVTNTLGRLKRAG